MEENKNIAVENAATSAAAAEQQDERSVFDFQAIFSALVLNWKWFVLSIIFCLSLAAIYLRYTTPIYQAFAKMIIKDGGGGTNRGALLNSMTMGTISNASGIETEMEILRSRYMAEQTVRDLKLYTTYKSVGRVSEVLLYKNQPITVDIDPAHLEKLSGAINLEIEAEKKGFHVSGTYGKHEINKLITKLPATIQTPAGILTFTQNTTTEITPGATYSVQIVSPRTASYGYVGRLAVAQSTKSNSIAQLVMSDPIPQRAADYLRQLVICYNRQANEDKNEIAVNTEAFINSRLEKINAELGATESELQAYKQSHGMVNLGTSAGNAFGNQEAYSKELHEANTQVQLINNLNEALAENAGTYKTLPSNVGLADGSASAMINRYNEIALERNRLLRSASETSPTVAPLTAQLDELQSNIQATLDQTRKNHEIRRNAIMQQYNKYSAQVGATPEQERMLTQIGRQQDVKSGLYLMLLQKREENSISLAATADKGKLVDEPSMGGKISPKSSMVMLTAGIAGLAIPAAILLLLAFFRYKIEGHEDVARLTKLPIIADVAVASDTAKSKADIVVHENKNSQMEEIFRSMRTNLQFVLSEHEKVVLFTSTTSGEGKTFNAANLAVSFALLGKKVILMGLDIRKPRLADLFELEDHKHGVTPLLIHDEPTWDMVKEQILPSGVNNNLDLLLAGPIPPNPTEILARESLEVVVNHLKEHYDYVLIDSAPVGLVTDTLQIARVADATIYMCRADYTPKESFGLINSLHAEKKLPKMNIVLNGIDLSKKKYGYYYGYGTYGRYGRYGRYKRYGYGGYGKHYGQGTYGTYGVYGNYGKSSYGDKNDTSVKR